MKASKYTALFHATGCISFLLLPLIFFPHPSNVSAILNNPPTQRDFIAQALLIGFFYFNYFYLIPNFYFNKRHFAFYTIIALCLLLIIFLPSLLTHHLPFHNDNHPPPDMHFNPPPQDFGKSGFNDDHHQPLPSSMHDDFPFFGEISHVIFLFFVVFFFSLSVKINYRLNKVQQEITTAQLSYFRSQINPHFLFNTLNLIYSLTIKRSKKAPEAIVTLANMMRYVIYESDKNFVPLENEIDYIKNYIRLQQSRFEASTKLLFDVNGETTSPNKKIAPLILIPFVENAFKHGVNGEENSLIKIHIDIDEQALMLYVYNTKVSKTSSPKNEGGVGLNNTTNRLQLLYPGKYELNINDNEKDFSVHLKLYWYD
jgi:hypothetical protein